MLKIKIRKTREEPSWNFDVIVEENKISSQHSISMGKDFYKDLNTNKQPRDVIYESFVFLLSKETKEDIKSEFDITLINYYFPDFKKYLIERLSHE